jgi:uncharacterized protein YecT (DUF1311 family)
MHAPAVMLLTIMVIAGCGRSRAADAGGDSALARDLAIVQMETNRSRDSAAAALSHAASTPAPPDSAGDSTMPPPLPADSTTAASQVASAAALPGPVDTPIHAAPRPSDPCASPDRSSQITCLRTRLAEYDAPLNRVYGRYVARLRAAPESRGGGASAIRRLRESQRAWLVYRDQMCQRRLAASEPKLWAPGRAACLGEYSAARTKLLTDMLDGRR